MTLLLITLGVILELIADVLFKKGMFAYGLVWYLLGTLLWARALTLGAPLGIAICIFTVLNMLGGVLLGYSVFHEALSLTQIAGILLGMISVILLMG